MGRQVSDFLLLFDIILFLPPVAGAGSTRESGRTVDPTNPCPATQDLPNQYILPSPQLFFLRGSIEHFPAHGIILPRALLSPEFQPFQEPRPPVSNRLEDWVPKSRWRFSACPERLGNQIIKQLHVSVRFRIATRSL